VSRSTRRQDAAHTEHFSNLVGGHAACTKPFEQSRRTGQGFDRASDHRAFDLLRGETPNLRAILASFGDRRSRDVVAIASTAPDGVRWGKAVPVTIG
jgi:hypothetical protein